MNYYVYLLISKNTNNIISYVGYTNSLTDRIKKHNTNRGAKFTKGRQWQLIYKKIYKNKKIALREEYKLKKNYLLRKKIKDNFLLTNKIFNNFIK